MLEAILKRHKKPSEEKSDFAKLEDLKKQITSIAQYESNCAAFLIDIYRKEFIEAGGDMFGLYKILLPVYEQAYVDQLKVVEEFKTISNGIYYERILERANNYADEIIFMKSRLKAKAKASST